jgi:hypothetical protein
LNSPKKLGRLTLQLDELWSFVGCKDNKQWVWLALIPIAEKWSVYLWESVLVEQQNNFGNRSLRFIATVQAVTPISGRRMSKCYRVSGTGQWARKWERPAISNGSTTP